MSDWDQLLQESEDLAFKVRCLAVDVDIDMRIAFGQGTNMRVQHSV